MRSHLLVALLALALAAAAAGAPCHEIGTWQRVADAPSRVTEAACAQVGSILHTLVGFDDYAGGGLRATDAHWALDLDTGTWSQKAPVPYAGSHTQATDNSTHIFLAGAFVGDYPGNATDRVYAYSVADDEWTELPSLPRPSASAGFVFVREFNSLFYFSGLVDFEKSTDAVHTLNLSSANAKWATLSTPFPDPRNHFLAKLVRPNLVVIPGGQHFNTNPDPIDLATVIGFNPENGTFYTLPPMPAERSHSDSVVSMGRLIVVGGRDNQAAAQIHNTILEYSPDDNAWYTLGAMPGQRLSPCVALHTNASGAWLWMAKGGVDWNVEVAETWVAKVDIKCNTEPTLPPTAAPTTAAPVATAAPPTCPVSTQTPSRPPPPQPSPPPPPSVETLPPAPTANRGATTASLIPPFGSASLRLGASVATIAAMLFCLQLL